jgi:hypothetical protein
MEKEISDTEIFELQEQVSIAQNTLKASLTHKIRLLKYQLYLNKTKRKLEEGIMKAINVLELVDKCKISESYKDELNEIDKRTEILLQIAENEKEVREKEYKTNKNAWEMRIQELKELREIMIHEDIEKKQVLAQKKNEILSKLSEDHSYIEKSNVKLELISKDITELTVKIAETESHHSKKLNDLNSELLDIQNKLFSEQQVYIEIMKSIQKHESL